MPTRSTRRSHADMISHQNHCIPRDLMDNRNYPLPSVGCSQPRYLATPEQGCAVSELSSPGRPRRSRRHPPAAGSLLDQAGHHRDVGPGRYGRGGTLTVPLVRRGCRARSPRPATPTPAGSWWRPPGITDRGIASARSCGRGGIRRRRRPAPGATRATVASTAGGWGFSNAGNDRWWRTWRSPGSWRVGAGRWR